MVFLAYSFLFEHGQNLAVVDEGAEGADLFTLLALLDGLKSHLQRTLTPLQNPAVSATKTFIEFLSSLPVQMLGTNRVSMLLCHCEDEVNLAGPW